MRAPGEMEMVKVLKVIKESSSISTVLFSPVHIGRWSGLVPGQFLMVWIPGTDEVPMSVSFLKREPFRMGMTVQNIGEATQALCSLKQGDWIGIRGPYGYGFNLPSNVDKDLIIGVSGGVGAASTILAMEWARSEDFRTVNLVGARDRSLLVFRDRWRSISDEVRFSTDDGSFGHKGLVGDLLNMELLAMSDHERQRTMVFTCGPEIMMVQVKRLLDQFGVEGQFSLERFMKCGIGLCDSCSASGKRVCMDGPVFSGDAISLLRDFGRSHRDRSGRPLPLKECVR
ncbi:MAG: dihydroorotate dehydrogenase electron transfer subunit [Candidatus Thermoplasmatota archaeon]|nr:dihydroorotate dehydrogenase electron transfer subunit [Candidatus Thermoplasmatota archaeon]